MTTAPGRRTSDRSVAEIYRGVLLLMTDARKFRATESAAAKGPLRRTRPSTKPIRVLLRHIRAEYDKHLDWLNEPESRRHRQSPKPLVTDVREQGHFPAPRKQREAEGLGGLTQWRLAVENDQWSTKRVRHQVLMIGVAFEALDRLDDILDELDDWLSRRWTLADMKANRDGILALLEMLEVVATVFAVEGEGADAGPRTDLMSTRDTPLVLPIVSRS